MYLLAFLLGWGLLILRANKPEKKWSNEDIGDLVFYVALGVVVGGRLGYVLFYQPEQFLHNPLDVFKIWQGGMSFHGGLIGVLIAIYLFGKKFHRSFLEVLDFVAPVVPLGIACGRMGNFINGELWGCPTDMPWGMVFPKIDQLPRHPSQLYEFLLEGVLLFILLWWYSSKPRRPGNVAAVFAMLYATFRFFVEFFREPDAFLGYIAFGWLTMGQLLSIPLFLAGAIYFFWRKSS
jgi:phosphatidylglycerol:prolipoprotein diacylglycerol transferase